MYITSSDVKQFGGIPTTDTVDDEELTLLIARAQKYIESYTGRVFESDSDAEEARYYTASQDVFSNTLYLDGDLNTVVSVVAGTDTLASTDLDYVTEPRNSKPYYGLTLTAGSSRIWSNSTSDGDYENAITVTGQWAYTSDAPADIQHACIRLVKWFYKQGRVTDETADRPIVLESGATVLPTQIPRDVIEILNYYRKMNVGVA